MWFLYGPPTSNPFGRENEVNSLLALMKNGQPVGLIGPRRIGKTSIILASLKKVPLPYAYISAEEFVRGEKGFNFAEFLSAYVSKLTYSIYAHAGYRGQIQRAMDMTKGYVKQLRDLIGMVKVSFNIPELTGLMEVILDKSEKNKDLSEEFSRVLDLPEVLAERFEIQRIIFVVDEFQYLKLARQAVPEIFHVMRSKWQFHRKVSYVISGSATGMLEELINSRSQPFYQFFYMTRITPFARDVSKEFLRTGFEAENLRVREEELDTIVDYVDGFPAWLNLVGIKMVVERRSVSEVLQSLPEDENVITALEGDLRKLSSFAKSVLKAMCKLGGEARPKDLGDDQWAVTRALQQLMRFGYVEREERGVYRVVDPMVVHYLQSR
ncbi:AAA family ATPase [Metallosphaera javensis (ex Sakai et al. 2022)]|uniref:AAA family ATPase n=1 Tax=Metallosphaera javensis (ex Sakai et al. 2022) TaxID=2775498 RepID=UPI00258B4C66|nr:MAG: ATPase [Metallosphaera javensis (ex Sakai et al. 2022)]